MQERGYISDYKVLVGKRMTRVYYHLEQSGRDYLQTLMSEYSAIVTGVSMIMEATEE